MAKNIIDVPRQSQEGDLLGIDKYTDALVTFIEDCDMPVTLAIQGEWGSGKTSLINQLAYRLCEMDTNAEKPYYGIWLNTWQYSLMKSREETLIAIMGALIKKIVEILRRKHETKTQAAIMRVGNIFSKVAKAGAKAALSTAGIGGDIVDELTSGNSGAGSDLLDLRRELEKSINDCLKEDNLKGDKKKGFVFFVDDLDRIDPPVAVEILELLKNIFEVGSCIFVLAIDYEVVVKGLVPKFGPLTEKNEREFRSFFDKIIQVPFAMPISSYNVSKFLSDSLERTGYISAAMEKDNENLRDNLANMVLLSVGTNPRSLKRLINTISLLNILDMTNNPTLERPVFEKQINFGLVCIQIAYPSIYNHLVAEPDFKKWDEASAKKLRLKPLTDEQRELLATQEEFDEEWEQIVFRMGQGDYYLASRVYSISQILNAIAEYVPDDMQLGEVIERLINLSAVTTVSLDASKKQKVESVNTGKYVRFEGIDVTIQSLNENGVPISATDELKKLFLMMSEKFGNKISFDFMPVGFLTNMLVDTRVRSKALINVRLAKKALSVYSRHQIYANGNIKTEPQPILSYQYIFKTGEVEIVRKEMLGDDSNKARTIEESVEKPTDPIQFLIDFITETYNQIAVEPI